MDSISLISTSKLLPSTSIIKCAAKLSVNGMAVLSHIAEANFIDSISINSMALGVMPALKIALTASLAFSKLLKGANINKSCFGWGMSLKTILVTIPKVPSLPTISCVILYPVAFFNTFDPVQIISPLGKTTSRFKT